MGGAGERHGPGSSPEGHHSDEKLKRPGSTETNKKGKGSDPVTKGKVSDGQQSKSSQSLDSEKEGKFIK